MKTVIEMAREAKLSPVDFPTTEQLERFTELVRADERNSWPAQQEPVAWMTKTGSVWKTKADETDTPLYTFPPAQRTWVGLTDEEIEQGCKESWVTEQAWQSAVWWAEAKLKEKNT